MAEPSRVRTLLARELLRVRDLAGLSGREMARRLRISQPKMSRIDRGLITAQRAAGEAVAD